MLTGSLTTTSGSVVEHKLPYIAWQPAGAWYISIAGMYINQTSTILYKTHSMTIKQAHLV